jgi:hypothetical protein
MVEPFQCRAAGKRPERQAHFASHKRHRLSNQPHLDTKIKFLPGPIGGKHREIETLSESEARSVGERQMRRTTPERRSSLRIPRRKGNDPRPDLFKVLQHALACRSARERLLHDF